MYLTKEQVEDVTKEFADGILGEYKDKLFFVTSLITTDDWTFVIKSQALIETLMNELVDVHLAKPELTEIIDRMPLHGSVSKISTALSLKIISKEEVRFITSLSQIRNNIVHKFINIDFTFDSYVTSLAKDKLNELRQSLRVNSELVKQDTLNAYYEKSVKYGFWLAVYTLIVCLIERINTRRAQNSIDKAAHITTEALLAGEV